MNVLARMRYRISGYIKPVMGMVFLSAFLSACSKHEPSNLQPIQQQSTKTDNVDYSKLLGLPNDSLKPASENLFSVSAPANAFSDQKLLIPLVGQVNSEQQSAGFRYYWIQTSGPQAFILNANQASTQAVLPQVTQPTSLTFEFIALDQNGFFDHAKSTIKVLPNEQALYTVETAASEQQGQIRVQITLNKTSQASVTFSYSTEDGTATAGTDYTPQNGEFTLSPNSPSTELLFLINNDTEQELNEYFSLHIRSPFGGQQVSYLAILDDDQPIAPSKPQVTAVDPSTLNSLPGTRGQLRALLLGQSSQALPLLSINDPCSHTEAATACQSNKVSAENGVYNNNFYSNAFWADAATGTYSFGVTNPTDQVIHLDLYLQWGNNTQHWTGVLAAGESIEITQVELTEKDKQDSTPVTPIEKPFEIPCVKQEGGCSVLQTNGNPYQGTTVYIDPDYQKHVRSYASKITDPDWIKALNIIENTPTAIWIDKTEMLLEGDAETQRRSIKEQLTLASIQQFSGETASPMAVQVVLRTAAQPIQENTESYIETTIKPFLTLAAQHPNLRLITVLEPHLLPESITTLSDGFIGTDELLTTTVKMLAEAENKNIYIYIGAGHSAWIVKNFKSFADKIQNMPLTSPKFRGFATNIASYSATEELLFTKARRDPTMLYTQNASALEVYFDELEYISGIQKALTRGGIQRELSFIIDTSRNGWGGKGRPTLAGGPQSLIDQRLFRANWCNLKEAGIGAFPTALPDINRPQIDAFTWVKQPGYSDGNSSTEGSHSDLIDSCDERRLDSRAGAPKGGFWFADHFTQLVENAWPPLLPNRSPTPMPFIELTFELAQLELTDSEIQQVMIRGAIGDEDIVNTINVFISGVPQIIPESALSINNNSFEIDLSQLEYPQPIRLILDGFSSINESMKEIRIEAIDNSGASHEQTINYAIQSNQNYGSEGNDVYYYDRYSRLESHANTYEGDDLLLPIMSLLDQYSRFTEVSAGKGNDTIYAISGNLFGGEGNDKFNIQPQGNLSSGAIWTNGESGHDKYVYSSVKNSGPGTTHIVEPDDKAEIDTLEFLNNTPENIQKIEAVMNTNNLLDIVITIKENETVTIENYATKEGKSGNTIETIIFSDGTRWGFSDVMENISTSSAASS